MKCSNFWELPMMLSLNLFKWKLGHPKAQGKVESRNVNTEGETGELLSCSFWRSSLCPLMDSGRYCVKTYLLGLREFSLVRCLCNTILTLLHVTGISRQLMDFSRLAWLERHLSSWAKAAESGPQCRCQWPRCKGITTTKEIHLNWHIIAFKL